MKRFYLTLTTSFLAGAAALAASVKVSELPTASAAANADQIMVNVSNAGAGTFTSKRISIANLFTGRSGLSNVSESASAVAVATNLTVAGAIAGNGAGVTNVGSSAYVDIFGRFKVDGEIPAISGNTVTNLARSLAHMPRQNATPYVSINSWNVIGENYTSNQLMQVFTNAAGYREFGYNSIGLGQGFYFRDSDGWLKVSNHLGGDWQWWVNKAKAFGLDLYVGGLAVDGNRPTNFSQYMNDAVVFVTNGIKMLSFENMGAYSRRTEQLRWMADTLKYVAETNGTPVPLICNFNHYLPDVAAQDPSICNVWTIGGRAGTPHDGDYYTSLADEWERYQYIWDHSWPWAQYTRPGFYPSTFTIVAPRSYYAETNAVKIERNMILNAMLSSAIDVNGYPYYPAETNTYILGVNLDPVMAPCINHGTNAQGVQLLTKVLQGGDVALALFNRTESEVTTTVPFRDVCLYAEWNVIDCGAKKDNGRKTSVSATIAGTLAKLYRLSPADKAWHNPQNNFSGTFTGTWQSESIVPTFYPTNVVSATNNGYWVMSGLATNGGTSVEVTDLSGAGYPLTNLAAAGTWPIRVAGGANGLDAMLFGGGRYLVNDAFTNGAKHEVFIVYKYTNSATGDAQFRQIFDSKNTSYRHTAYKGAAGNHHMVDGPGGYELISGPQVTNQWLMGDYAFGNPAGWWTNGTAEYAAVTTSGGEGMSGFALGVYGDLSATYSAPIMVAEVLSFNGRLSEIERRKLLYEYFAPKYGLWRVQTAPTAAEVGGTSYRTNYMIKAVDGKLMSYWSDGSTLYSKQIAP